MPPQRTIIGIDPSLSATAVVVGGKDTGHRVNVFSSKNAGRKVPERIARYESLANDVTDWAYPNKDCCVFIEGYSMGAHSSSVTSLCEYGAILRAFLLRGTDRIFEVPPQTLKKFATGKGNSAKDLVAAHITKRYGVLLDSTDQYDAYALWRFGLVATGQEEPANKAQLEAVRAVMNPQPKPKKKPKQP